MPTSIEQSWQEIIDISESITSLALKKEWVEVSELSKIRHITITQHFDKFPASPETASFYQHHLSQFFIQEEKLQALAKGARKEALKQGMVSSGRKRAVDAYAQLK